MLCASRFAMCLRDSILAAARSRSWENNTQLFSNALAPLRYPCLLGKRFSIQRALSSRIERSQARYSVASLLTMCSRHSLASFLVALLTLPPLHRRIVATYRLRKPRLCRLVALGGFGFAKIIINCFCSPTHCDRTQI